ncbi:two-component system regulatory protein YycI [Lentibacillus saliphilus]|uniref:two-component system regulatory protein YycI n=1 Tax=Lentibacillus saliphilus TaxID=2737028 RepID=UPI001C30BE16|nr:two-component system regulatory protein YycI [Lentibacillus saliphilus]
MLWRQIKTLFIFSFLILDLFLLMQLIDKQKNSDLGIMESEDTTIEQQLEDENIDIKASLSQEQLEENYIAVDQKNFGDAEKTLLKALADQSHVIIDNNLLLSQLDKPVSIPKDSTAEDIKAIAGQYFLYPEQYTYWNWNKDKNILLFFQEKSGRPVYYNQSGLVMIFLNDDNEVTYFIQTILGEAEKTGSQKQLISPLNAIDELYKGNELYPNDEITKVDIGFHTMVPLPNGIQSFAPSWKITVNDDKHFFVNAIEGRIFFSNEYKFIEDTLMAIRSKIQASGLDEEEKEQILPLVEQNLETAE